MSRTFVIAEAGSCHDGRLDAAVALVQAAREAGADAVKFQWWSDPAHLAGRRRAWTAYETYQRYQIPVEWLCQLRREAKNLNLEFLCTVYLPEDVPIAASLVDRFKVASLEASDLSFVAMHLTWRKPLIVSTGCLTDGELAALLKLRDDSGSLDYGQTPLMSLLHCVCAYPAPRETVNLSWIRALGLDGFSDHTGDVQMGGRAVLAGARIVEAHLRLDSTARENPDFGHSLAPGAFADYVGCIREAGTLLGSGGTERAILACERPLRQHSVGAIP